MSDQPPSSTLPPPARGTRVGDPPPAGDGGGRRSGRRKRIVVAAAIGAGVLLLPFAGYLAIEATTSDGGADNPEAAVQAMFDAVGDEDVLGLMDTLLPGERRSLGDPIRDIVDELQRLEILSADADLGDVDGIDLEFVDLTYATEEIADGITIVEVTGGRVEGDADLGDLPLGDLLLDVGFGGEQPTGTERGSEPIDGDVRIATVEDGGRWYVSLWFTVAEAARTAAGAPPPDPSAAIAPVGSASPEEVLDDLFDAAGRLDLTAVLAMLPPGEARALHVYASLFLEDAQAALDELRDESGLSVDIASSEYDVDRDGSRATVVPAALTATVAADGEEATVAIADGCATIEAGGERQELCADDAEEILAEGGLDTSDADGSGDLGDLIDLTDLTDLDVGFEVVRENGRWYLSPTATVLRPVVAVLAALEAEDVRALIELSQDGFDVDPGDT